MLLSLRLFRAAARGRLGSFKVQGFEYLRLSVVEGSMLWGSLEFILGITSCGSSGFLGSGFFGFRVL